MSTRNVEIDRERMLAEARELSFPRYPGSAGDRRAISWVAEKLVAAGLQVEEEWFSYDVEPAWRALRGLILGCGALVAASGLVAHRSTVWALLLLAVALTCGGVFLTWAPWLEGLYRRSGATRSANVEGRRIPTTKPVATLVVLAHHDSKSQSLSLPWRAALTHVAMVGALGLAVVLLSLSLEGNSQAVGAWPPVLGAMAGLALLLLSTLRNGNESPGGVDNAGSVAILLELARVLKDRIPEHLELIFLSTGSEEDHMVGAMRWLEEHRTELEARPALALNLDGAGNPGTLALLERYGLGRRFSPRVSRAARQAAQDLGFQVRSVYLPPALGIDAIPFVHQGVECLTLASGSLNRATLSVHSKNDIPDHLHGPTLEQVARLAVGTVERLAASFPPFSKGGGETHQPNDPDAHRADGSTADDPPPALPQ